MVVLERLRLVFFRRRCVRFLARAMEKEFLSDDKEDGGWGDGGGDGVCVLRSWSCANEGIRCYLDHIVHTTDDGAYL